MKFIELHDETDTFWVNTDAIAMIETETVKDRPQISSCIILKNDCWHYSKETPEEIFQKIAEATQSERVEIFQKFAEAEQRECEKIAEEKKRRERSFMDDWKREVDEQLSRLTIKKDSSGE